MFEVPMFVWVIASASYFMWATAKLIEQVSDAKSEIGYREENRQRMRLDRERFDLEKAGKTKKKNRKN